MQLIFLLLFLINFFNDSFNWWIPILIFAAWTIGNIFDALLISSKICLFKPVVPITRGLFFLRDSWITFFVDSGCEKSITTSAESIFTDVEKLLSLLISLFNTVPIFPDLPFIYNLIIDLWFSKLLSKKYQYQDSFWTDPKMN